jgi:putative aldouronate transport system permease protein
MRTKARPPLSARFVHAVKRDYQLWILLFPTLLVFLVCSYLPLYGIQIAFKDFRAVQGILGSAWAGLKHFRAFFSSYYAPRLITNTFLLNLLNLAWGFPVPLILALTINQFEREGFKRFAQSVIYIPHFISTIVMAGILYLFLSPSSGVVNVLIKSLGGEPIFFMNEASWFRTLFVGSDIWQHAGWNAILFIAALSGIDRSIYEAAVIDGANKRQKIWHIDIPHLIPIAVMMLILNCGSLLGSNTDKALAMQQAGNMSTSDIIGVYVYNQGLGKAQFSYTAAIGLTINIVNFIMVYTVNYISRKLGDTSLF